MDHFSQPFLMEIGECLKLPGPNSLGNEFSLNLADMAFFPTNISYMVKKYMYLICKQFEKTMFMLLIVL